jgi:hypothetical protein
MIDLPDWIYWALVVLDNLWFVYVVYYLNNWKDDKQGCVVIVIFLIVKSISLFATLKLLENA